MNLDIVCPICKGQPDVNIFEETDTLYTYSAYCRNCNCAFAVTIEKTEAIKIPKENEDE